jgi:hypothetical protein
MSCANRNVNLDNRMGLDDCALAANEKQNKMIDDYYLYNARLDCNDKEYMNIAACNNMVPNNGFGYSDACNIDNDSRLRNGSELTDKKYLNQKFRKCGANKFDNCDDDVKSIENRMRRGNDYGLKRCDTLSEASTLDLQFVPMVKCLKDNIQNPNHIVPTWIWGGEPTRDSLKQKEFLEDQGFRFTNGIAHQACGFQN